MASHPNTMHRCHFSDKVVKGMCLTLLYYYIEKTQIVKQKWSKTYCIRWELGFKKNVKKYNTQELYVNSNPEYQIFPLNYFGCSPLIFHHNHCKIFIFLIHVSLAGKNQVNIHILKILRLFHWIKKTDIPYSCLKITI